MAPPKFLHSHSLHHDADASNSIILPYDGHLEAQVSPGLEEKHHVSTGKTPRWGSLWECFTGSKVHTTQHPVEHYELFKDKYGKGLVDSHMRCVTLYPSARDDFLNSNDGKDPRLLSAPDDITVENYLQVLVKALDPDHDRYLQVCAFITSHTPEAKNAFSFLQSLRASFGDRLDRLYHSPLHAIVHHVAEEWRLEPSISDALTGLREAYPRYPSTRLPSRRSGTARPDVLFKRGTSMTLEWQANIQKYKNDIDNYVWQYHLTPPNSLSITVFTLPTEDVEQRRVAVLFSSPKLLHERLTRLTQESKDEDGKEKKKKRYLDWSDGFPWQHEWSASHEVLNLILLFYDWMTEDTARFFDAVGAELRNMTYWGRRWPSPGKVQYLVHLDDCRRKALEDLTHNAETLKLLVAAVESSEFCCKQAKDQPNFLSLIEVKQADIQFLKRRIQGLARPIQTVRDQIIEQMNLASGWRTLLLTILAALFIPLSFVSGIFGMNVTDPLFPSGNHTSHEGPTTSQVEDLVTTGLATLSTLATLPLTSPTSSTVVPSSTASATSVSSNQHFWDVSLYLEIALPLAVTTIILPLITGSIIRVWVRTAYHYRLYWRILLAVGALAYLGFVYGFLYWFSDDCGSDCPLFWYYDRSYATFVLYTVLVPGVQGSIAIWALYRAVRLRRRRRLWALFAVLVVGSVLVEMFVDYPSLTSWGQNDFFNNVNQDANGWTEFRPIPFTWIPWVFLLVYWISDLHSSKNRDKPSAFPFSILKDQRKLSLITPWRTEKA